MRGLGIRSLLFPLDLAYRNMMARKIRTSLTCLGITLGVAAILAVAMINQSTLDSIEQVFNEAAGSANLTIIPYEQDSEGFDESIRDKVADMAGIHEVAPSITEYTQVMDNQNKGQIIVGIGGRSQADQLMLNGIDIKKDPLLRSYSLSEGRWLEDDRYEVILTEHYLVEKEYSLGKDLVILTPDGIEKLTIVGVLQNKGAGVANTGNVGFVPISVLQDIFDRGGKIDAIDCLAETHIAGSQDRLEELRISIQNSLGDDYLVQYPASRGQLVPQMLFVYQQGLSFFSVMAIFIGAFLIYNTFSTTVIERTREIGMLRTVGMTKKQIFALVLGEAAALGCVGSLFGLAFGILLGHGLLPVMGLVLASSISTITLPPEGITFSLAVGIFVTIASASIPAFQAMKISPIEALRAIPPQRSHSRNRLWIYGLIALFLSWLLLYKISFPQDSEFSAGVLGIFLLFLGTTLFIPRLVELLEPIVRPAATLLYKYEGKMGSRNIRRSPIRTTLTIACLMIGIALIIGFGAMTTSFKNDFIEWVNSALGGDIMVSSAFKMREQFGWQLMSIEGVEAVTPRSIFDVRLASESAPQRGINDKLTYYAIDPETYRNISDIQFLRGQGSDDAIWQQFRSGKYIFISTVVSDIHALKQGDRLFIETKRGSQPFTVAAVMVDFNPKAFIIYGPLNDAYHWFNQTGVDSFFLSVKPGYSVDNVKSEIENRYKKARSIVAVSSQQLHSQIMTLVNQSFGLLDALNYIAMIISALGVINTLMMNVMERQQEIGGMRSIGMTRGQVIKMIISEGSTLGIIGGIFGLATGVIIAEQMVRALNLLASYDLSLILPLSVFLWGAGIALIVAQAAAYYPAWKAGRVNIIAAIQHE